MWRVVSDPDATPWASACLVSDESLRVLWLCAGEAVEGAWLEAAFVPLAPGLALARDVREVTVAEAVAAAPEHAELILATTRRIAGHYVRRRKELGTRLAAQLEQALGSVEAAGARGATRGAGGAPGGGRRRRREDQGPLARARRG